MSKYALELLTRAHDRKGFHSGRESIDRYFKQTARSHLEKGIAVTRVLVPAEPVDPKPVIGFFTLSQISIEATDWDGAKGLPTCPVPAVLLSRLGVDHRYQGQGISRLLDSAALMLAQASIDAAGGIGMVLDAADESLIDFYEKFGFVRAENLRMFLPRKSFP